MLPAGRAVEEATVAAPHLGGQNAPGQFVAADVQVGVCRTPECPGRAVRGKGYHDALARAQFPARSDGWTQVAVGGDEESHIEPVLKGITQQLDCYVHTGGLCLETAG